MFIRRVFACLGSCSAALVLAASPATARPPAAVLSAEDKALVDRATAYLQNLKTVTGHFTQIDPQGATSGGEFDMQRPGKARFQYDPPAQLLVVSDGYNVSIYDRKLKTFDQYPLGATPLVLLLARQVRLDRGVVITSVDHSAEGFSITARDARKQAEGRITILFGDEPMALRGWTVVDAQGQETRVHLGELKPVSNLDPNLFSIRDARP